MGFFLSRFFFFLAKLKELPAKRKSQRLFQKKCWKAWFLEQ